MDALTVFFLFSFSFLNPVFCLLIVAEQNLIVDELNLAAIGPKFEHHEMFPARTNTG